MNSKLDGMIGLCQRAGKCQSGVENCEKAIRSGKARLAILDRQAKGNSREKIEAACRAAGVPLIEAEAPGRAVGKPERMALAIMDSNFAKAIADIPIPG